MSIIDHFGFSVSPSKFDEVIKFYETALAPLGISKQKEIPGKAIGFGASPESAPFWVASKEDSNDAGLHIAFKAADHAQVDKFHEEALKAGGADNGKPGPRPQYHANYYAAFIFDPVG